VRVTSNRQTSAPTEKNSHWSVCSRCGLLLLTLCHLGPLYLQSLSLLLLLLAAIPNPDPVSKWRISESFRNSATADNCVFWGPWSYNSQSRSCVKAEGLQSFRHSATADNCVFWGPWSYNSQSHPVLKWRVCNRSGTVLLLTVMYFGALVATIPHSDPELPEGRVSSPRVCLLPQVQLPGHRHKRPQPGRQDGSHRLC
jgi:hypothetical protein